MQERILAIDPGPEQSAWLLYNGRHPEAFGIDLNDVLIHSTGPLANCDHLAIEGVACFGMPVGAEVFNTCIWIGRMMQACPRPSSLVYRKDVKMHLCG